ncbi:GreA/GreB family elongation factor [Amycolatopsis nigrescens]|uniref:GreA/GreB family elongation factor n=1 Tax=Amycolatopsis nigrescens TaxID=381445 RepID=UPI0003678CE1|nr:GreA/GreB family elongation factor [Amycolatopsis nigrescens]
MVSKKSTGLSAEARRQLEQELVQLREQRVTNAPPPGEQRGVGDSADQADLLERAEAAAYLDRRIAEVTELLTYGDETVSSFPDGTAVTLRFEDGSEDILHVVAVIGEDTGADGFTMESPLGKALEGHQPGDTITYRPPRGPVTATIVAIEPPD